jgi:hypothetical protein
MKTPRDILFERHRSAQPQLDSVRRAIVAELNHKVTTELSSKSALVSLFLRGSKTLWRELFLPSRRVWSGLAAVWVLIFLTNFSLRDSANGPAGKSYAAPTMAMNWQMQQRWMNELFADRAPVPDTERPKSNAPKPRSEAMGLRVI